MRTINRFLILVLLSCVLVVSASAQTTTVMGTVLDASGNPYANGTASAQRAVIAGQNPGFPISTVTNGSGTFSFAALPSPASYVFTICGTPIQLGPKANPVPTQVCFNSTAIAISGASQDIGAVLSAIAPLLGPSFASFTGAANTFSQLQTFSAGISVSPVPTNCTNSVATGIGSTLAANCTNSTGVGGWSVGGTATFANLDGIQFVDGVTNTTVQAAINALPASGGLVIATSAAGSTSLGTIDPGTGAGRAVTVILGPFSYTATQVKLRNNFRLIGMGPSGVNATSITFNAAASSAFAVADKPTQGVNIEGLIMYGVGTGTQNGLDLDITGAGGSGGVWHSTFKNLRLSNFTGIPVHLKAPVVDGVNQFDVFENIDVNRFTGGPPALQIEGANGQISFTDTDWEGPTFTSLGDGVENVLIQTLSGSDTNGPYSLSFNNMTIEGGNVGIQIAGGKNLKFDNVHFESLYGAVNIVADTNFPNTGIEFHDELIAWTVGVHSGAGYVLQSNSPTAIIWVNAQLQSFGNPGTPDNIFLLSAGATVQTGTVANGTIAMPTALITSLNCAASVSASAPGVLATDSIKWSFNQSPGAPNGFLTVVQWPAAGNVFFTYCNPTASSQTPGAATINWRVIR